MMTIKGGGELLLVRCAVLRQPRRVHTIGSVAAHAWISLGVHRDHLHLRLCHQALAQGRVAARVAHRGTAWGRFWRSTDTARYALTGGRPPARWPAVTACGG